MARWTVRQRLTLVGSIFADVILTAGLIWFAFPNAEAQPPAAPQVAITGGDNVVSVGQIGGITARVVTINPPLQPEFRILNKTERVNPDGRHEITITGSVASPFMPGLLTLQIQAPGIRDVNVVSTPVGGISMTNLRNVRRAPGFYSVEIPSPQGRNIITVVTVGTSDIEVNASF